PLPASRGAEARAASAPETPEGPALHYSAGPEPPPWKARAILLVKQQTRVGPGRHPPSFSVFGHNWRGGKGVRGRHRMPPARERAAGKLRGGAGMPPPRSPARALA